MNEIQAQECYGAVGILLAHRDVLDSEPLLVPNNGLSNSMILFAIQQKLIDYLPCQCKFYTVTDTIRHNHDNHLEVEVTCDSCGKVGLKLFDENQTENISWDS